MGTVRAWRGLWLAVANLLFLLYSGRICIYDLTTDEVTSKAWNPQPSTREHGHGDGVHGARVLPVSVLECSGSERQTEMLAIPPKKSRKVMSNDLKFD